MKKKFTIVCCLLMFMTFDKASAQSNAVAEDSALFQIMAELDHRIFGLGFNDCKLDEFEQLIDDDFEFYHDGGGMTLSKQDFIDSIDKNICHIDYKPYREIVPGTMKVYPLYQNGELYGALKILDHNFYALRDNAKPELTTQAKLTALWIKTGDSWKMKRSFSFDHHKPID